MIQIRKCKEEAMITCYLELVNQELFLGFLQSTLHQIPEQKQLLTQVALADQGASETTIVSKESTPYPHDILSPHD
jgi:hypothetical protein